MSCVVKVRLPDGSTLEETFDETDPLLVVQTLCESRLNETGLLLSIPYPRKIFEPHQLATLTLKEAGLSPKGALICQKGIATSMKEDKNPMIKPGVHHIHSEDEYNKFKKTPNALVVVDFSASWCGPCKAIAPVYESLANKYTTVLFLHVDVDDLSSLPDVSDVKGVPTFKFFKNNAMVSTFSGADAQKLEATIIQYK